MSTEKIDRPSYYTVGGIEAIDVIEAWDLGFCLGNAVKYICRAGRKHSNQIEDLKKAQWYLNREIQNAEYVEKPEKGLANENHGSVLQDRNTD